MEAKHTPGPWRTKQLANYEEPGWVVLWPDKGGTHMRRIDYRGNFTEQDARLIAAAPELLEALIAMLENFESQHGLLLELGAPAFVAMQKKVHAAIAKATQ